MKKKLEAELISIAHRILKLKNRAELDQLQAETLRLYEKISVLRFVEDNFGDVKPTIGYASAEETLEEIYGIEEVPEVHANEVEAKEDKARAEKKKSPPAPKEGAPTGEDTENKTDDKKDAKSSEEPANEEVEEDKTDDIKTEDDIDPEQKVEEYQASEEEKEHTEEETDESAQTPKGDDEEPVKEDEPETDEEPEPVEEPAIGDGKPEEIKEPDTKEEKEKATEQEEPEHKVEVVKPEEEVKAMEEGAAAVFGKEDESTPEEEEKAADAEVVTIEPDASAKTEDSRLAFEFAFERKPAPEEPQKQKEITFEDYHDYIEPEFVKKDDQQPKAEEKKEDPKAGEKPAVDDWRNWEPAKPTTEAPKPTPAEEKPAAPKAFNDSFGKTITLGLNDRIAFEKNLFGGSSEDLNRVLSQINTHNSFDEAKAFIEDLVKPDYNDWQGKEDYEARFMEIVEKKFE